MNREIKLPFALSYKLKVGKEYNIKERNIISIFELRGLVNIGSILLKSGKYGKEGFEVTVGNVQAGYYKVRISLDEFAVLFNILKDENKKEKNDQEFCFEM